jgi:DnaJ-class molecular chaperone
MTKNYYDILGVSKTASEAEIKKAYKKMAMQYHPDRNKGDKKAEAKFKEINEAYQTLSDTGKKKNYDQFWSADGNPFGWMWGWGGNPYGGWFQSNGSAWFGGFEDIFSQFGSAPTWKRGSGGFGSSWFEFDLGDILSGMGGRKSSKTRYEEPETYEPEKKTKEIPNVDVTEVVEIPFFDFLTDTSVDVRTVYGKHLTLKVKAGTKPGTKYKISGKGRTMDGKTGDMYVIVDAKMPKDIPVSLKPMIEALRSHL